MSALYIRGPKEGPRFIVGWFHPNGWEPVEDCDSEAEARELVNYLNGGVSGEAVRSIQSLTISIVKLTAEYQNAQRLYARSQRGKGAR